MSFGDRKQFIFTRRIPRKLRFSASGGMVGSHIANHESGVTVFRNFDVGNPVHYQMANEIVTAVISLDRRNQLAAYNELKRAGVIALLEARTASRPEEAYAPDYVDLRNLYGYVRTWRPRRVLEFGSGLSTLTIAFALHQNGDGGKLYSVEPSEAWEKQTRALLTRELAPCCEVNFSAGAECSIAGIETVRFAEVPDVVPELMYLDGAPKGAKFLGAEEAYLLEERLAPGAAVMIDGRYHALLFFLDGNMRRGWKTLAQALVVEWPEPMKTNYYFGLDQYANALCVLEEPQQSDRLR